MYVTMKSKLKRLFISFARPLSTDEDYAQREFILNILLLISIILSFVGTVLSFTIYYIQSTQGREYDGLSPLIMLGIMVGFLILFRLSRVGKSRLASFTLLLIYFLGGTYTTLLWGADIPQALLTYALVIVMSGILINSRFALYATGVIFITLFIVVTTHQNGWVTPLSDWRAQPPHFGDAIAYGVTFIAMAALSWLFNREMERSLQRARYSEAALKKERDLLEVRVEERTRELRKAQFERMTQIYKFAELGKLASGIFHDLTVPLSLVSLNLETLDEERKQNEKKFSSIRNHLERAVMGTKRLESFIGSARKQIQNQEEHKVFLIKEEVMQTVQILEHKALKHSVRVLVDIPEEISFYGNAIRFHQINMNLISNAIDAYASIDKNADNRVVEVSVKDEDSYVVIKVKDNGSGISETNLEHIFDPLFTTKSSEKGTGIGLTICKQIVETEFKGTIQVTSSPHKGTMFIVQLPKIKINDN